MGNLISFVMWLARWVAAAPSYATAVEARDPAMLAAALDAIPDVGDRQDAIWKARMRAITCDWGEGVTLLCKRDPLLNEQSILFALSVAVQSKSAAAFQALLPWRREAYTHLEPWLLDCDGERRGRADAIAAAAVVHAISVGDFCGALLIVRNLASCPLRGCTNVVPLLPLLATPVPANAPRPGSWTASSSLLYWTLRHGRWPRPPTPTTADTWRVLGALFEAHARWAGVAIDGDVRAAARLMHPTDAANIVAATARWGAPQDAEAQGAWCLLAAAAAHNVAAGRRLVVAAHTDIDAATLWAADVALVALADLYVPWTVAVFADRVVPMDAETVRARDAAVVAALAATHRELGWAKRAPLLRLRAAVRKEGGLDDEGHD